MSKELICYTHDKIIEKINSIRNNIEKTLKYDLDDINELKSTLEDIDWELRCNIIDLVKEAKESSQSMEDRLYEYREAIISLGFSRDNKQKEELR